MQALGYFPSKRRATTQRHSFDDVPKVFPLLLELILQALRPVSGADVVLTHEGLPHGKELPKLLHLVPEAYEKRLMDRLRQVTLAAKCCMQCLAERSGCS